MPGRNDLAARLKAKGYEQHKGTAFLSDFGVPSFSLGDENRVQSANIPKDATIAKRPIKMDKPEGNGDA